MSVKERINRQRLEQLLVVLDDLGLDTSVYRITNNNLMIRCPFAHISGHAKGVDTKPSFGLKVTEKGWVFNCFTCPRKGTSISEFFEKLNEEKVVKVKNAFEIINKFKVDFPDYYVDDEEQVDSKEEIILIDDKWDKKFYLYNSIKRKLKSIVVVRARLHYDAEKGQVIFPVYNIRDNLVGYVDHLINKHVYISHVNKDEALYLEWLIKTPIAIVVEGMYDALKIYQYLYILKLLDKYSVVGLFGSQVARGQLKLLSTYFRTLILMGDNDEAGMKMEKVIYNSLHQKIPLIYRLDYKGKDPDEISLKQFERKLNKITLYGSKSSYL